MWLTFTNQGHNYNQTVRKLINIVKMLSLHGSINDTNGIKFSYKFEWCEVAVLPFAMGVLWCLACQGSPDRQVCTVVSDIGYNLKGSGSRHLYTFV